MADQPLSEVPVNHGRHAQSWTDSIDPLLHFVHEADISDGPIEKMIGAQSIRSEDTVALPLIFQYSRSIRRTFYRRGMAIIEPVGGAEGEWVEIDPHTSLRGAFDLYGWDNVLAYEKVVQHSTLEIMVMPFRTKHSQALRVLVRKKS
jgi:hypothetical protein